MVSFIFSPKDCKLAGNLTSWVAAPVKETLMPTSNGVIEIPTPSLWSFSLFLKIIEGWAEIGIFQTTSTKPPWSTRIKQLPFAAHRAGQCNNTLHTERGGVLPPRGSTDLARQGGKEKCLQPPSNLEICLSRGFASQGLWKRAIASFCKSQDCRKELPFLLCL